MNVDFKIFLLILVSLVSNVYSGALQLNGQNYDSTLAGHELVFVNFYASWCRFSQMLEPIFNEFADKVAAEIPDGRVSVARVDCEAEGTIALNNHVNKYPTLKLFRYGIPVKKEYRGARSAEAFLNYVKAQLENPIKVVKTYPEYSSALNDKKKQMVIGYFLSDQSELFKTFTKLSSFLRDSCSFIAVVAEQNAIRRDNPEQISFKKDIEQQEVVYNGDLNQYDALYAWANEKCTPLVREITFENAEELTEEGLPFLILFHKPEDTDSLRIFENEVAKQLGHYKNTINAVHADGNKFSHPLHHLGKSVSDLPVLAIDSFRHMYLFPDYNKLTKDNYLAKFVEDLHSGKLHREFHNGPDPTQEPPKVEQVDLNANNHLPKLGEEQKHNKPDSSTPPESVFVKLAPSENRYSIKYEGEL
ncbi:unnamed protein product [Brachionus calyciflorus]|uniref:Thioredoxin domain-containing protein n=1 Tax=Brachionus calyciflorus TaxID=104777 RepID=A0A813UGB4_9BILA|nr:unnamed protein product [Brachionus calyciflorus]